MARGSMLRTALLSLGYVVAFAAVVVGTLVIVFDMRVELAGSATRLIVSFGDENDHYADLEQHRLQHDARLLPAVAAPPPTPPRAEPAPTTERPEASSTVDSETGETAAAAPTHDAYWTSFRGPNRDGRYTQTPINTSWIDDGLVPLWKQPIGGGYASFVVADARAFTIEQRRDQEVVVAYDPATGRELWTHAWDTNFQEIMGGPGPRSTPTWHDGRVYALGATGHFWCLDAETGAVIWHRDILEDSSAGNLEWAMAASPLIVGDIVIVQPGGRNGWSVVAYDTASGGVVWHALDDAQAYTSPMDVTLAGRRQVLVVTGERAVGLGVEDGTLLWEYSWTPSGPRSIAQPVQVGNDRVFLSAGYGHGAAVIRLTMDGDSLEVETVWQNTRMKNRFSSSVLLDGYIYGLDESILACVDAATGELQWKGGRYGYGQLLLAGDHLVVLTEDGDLALVRATPERHDERARFEAIDGKTWNVPAMADGRLFVRNAREMAAYDLRVQ